jgi:multisubunit Na+/H+ antiporter MnhB subunit
MKNDSNKSNINKRSDNNDMGNSSNKSSQNNSLLNKKIVKTIFKLAAAIGLAALIIMALSETALATELDPDVGLTQFDALISFIATWVGRIAMVVGLFGGIQFAMGLKSNNPDEKINGLMLLGAGLMVFALTQAYSWFINW